MVYEQEAEQSLVLCNVLCFLSNKYGRTDLKTLKLVIADFYTADVIAEAKFKLVEAVDMINLTTKRPDIRTRREGNKRLCREIDDLLSIYTFLDEQKCLDQLPIYVSSSPDSMPSLRLYDSDLNGLMTMLHGMNGKLNDFGAMLAAIMNDIKTTG